MHAKTANRDSNGVAGAPVTADLDGAIVRAKLDPIWRVKLELEKRRLELDDGQVRDIDPARAQPAVNR
jgi:hypothetical protein